jgi:hypothetical protein
MGKEGRGGRAARSHVCALGSPGRGEANLYGMAGRNVEGSVAM